MGTQTSKTKIRLGLVDDHNLFRKGLIKLVNLGDHENKYEIQFEAENGSDLKDKIDRKRLPDIIMMDIDMPDMDGFETVAWLNKYFPSVKVLVISMLETEEAIVRMLRLGVKGYLSKDIEVEDMHIALNAIAEKGFYYSDLVATIMAKQIQQGDTSASKPIQFNLTENEIEFIKLACTDLTYQQIADKMHLSPKTVDGYRETVFGKLNVKSRVALAMSAVKNGLVKP